MLHIRKVEKVFPILPSNFPLPPRLPWDYPGQRNPWILETGMAIRGHFADHKVILLYIAGTYVSLREERKLVLFSESTCCVGSPGRVEKCFLSAPEASPGFCLLFLVNEDPFPEFQAFFIAIRYIFCIKTPRSLASSEFLPSMRSAVFHHLREDSYE